MAEGPRAPLLRAAPGARIGETIPPESKTQPASEREDPHESVTIAPPAPNFEDMLRQSSPLPSFSNKGDHHFRAALDASSQAGMDLAELSKLANDLLG